MITQDKLFEMPRDPREVILPSTEVAQARILATLDKAGTSEMQEGSDWYFEANRLCKEWADEFDCDPKAVAGIIAVISPRREWSNNLTAAREVLATGSCVGPRAFVGPAESIRLGADPDEVIYDPKRNGLKVRAFYDNISNPYDSRAVTIDRHIWGILMGSPDALRQAGLYIKPSENAWAQDMYRQLADSMGDIMPHQLQATSWVVWRNSLRRATGAAALAQDELDFTA